MIATLRLEALAEIARREGLTAVEVHEHGAELVYAFHFTRGEAKCSASARHVIAWDLLAECIDFEGFVTAEIRRFKVRATRC